MNEMNLFCFCLAIPILAVAVWFALPAVFVTPWFESVMRRRMVRARAQYEATAAAIQAYEQVVERDRLQCIAERECEPEPEVTRS